MNHLQVLLYSFKYRVIQNISILHINLSSIFMFKRLIYNNDDFNTVVYEE